MSDTIKLIDKLNIPVPVGFGILFPKPEEKVLLYVSKIDDKVGLFLSFWDIKSDKCGCFRNITSARIYIRKIYFIQS